MMRHSCDGCAHDLGGGQCGQSVEGECCEGGGFQAWEPHTEFETFADAAQYYDRYMRGGRGFNIVWTEFAYKVRWER